jgi:hypothetical protein
MVLEAQGVRLVTTGFNWFLCPGALGGSPVPLGGFLGPLVVFFCARGQQPGRVATPNVPHGCVRPGLQPAQWQQPGRVRFTGFAARATTGYEWLVITMSSRLPGAPIWTFYGVRPRGGLPPLIVQMGPGGWR